MKFNIRILVLAVFLSVLFAFFNVGKANAAWLSSDIDTSGNAFEQNLLESDSLGNFVSVYNLCPTDCSLVAANSSDGGATWQYSTITTLPSYPIPYDLVTHNDVFYVVYYDGTDLIIATSVNHGVSWTSRVLYSDLNESAVAFDILPNGNYILAIVGTDNIQFTTSSNNGASWSTQVPLETGFLGVYSSIEWYVKDNNNFILAGSSLKLAGIPMPFAYANVKFWVSHNGGADWTSSIIIAERRATQSFFHFAQDSIGNILISYNNGGYSNCFLGVSEDNGDTWSTQSFGTNSFGCSVGVDKKDNYLFVRHEETVNPGMYIDISDDGGDTWTTTYLDSEPFASYAWFDLEVAAGEDYGILSFVGGGVYNLAFAYFGNDFTAPIPSVSSPGSSVSTTSVTVTGTITDKKNTVTSLQYALDGGAWTALTAGDGTFDESSETFSFLLSDLSEGSHSIVFRSVDSEGNTTDEGGEYTFVFTVGTGLTDTGAAIALPMVGGLLLVSPSIRKARKRYLENK